MPYVQRRRTVPAQGSVGSEVRLERVDPRPGENPPGVGRGNEERQRDAKRRTGELLTESSRAPSDAGRARREAGSIAFGAALWSLLPALRSRTSRPRRSVTGPFRLTRGTARPEPPADRSSEERTGSRARRGRVRLSSSVLRGHPPDGRREPGFRAFGGKDLPADSFGSEAWREPPWGWPGTERRNERRTPERERAERARASSALSVGARDPPAGPLGRCTVGRRGPFDRPRSGERPRGSRPAVQKATTKPKARVRSDGPSGFVSCSRWLRWGSKTLLEAAGPLLAAGLRFFSCDPGSAPPGSGRRSRWRRVPVDRSRRSSESAFGPEPPPADGGVRKTTS